MIKKCLVISNGPVPVPEHVTVEGGGLRCWGLAKGIHSNDPSVAVTVAYQESYKKSKFTKTFEGISLATWSDQNIQDLIEGYDTIVVSYCMGDLSLRVAEAVRPDQQLVLDCYVPIYIEVSARQSPRVEEEFRAFEVDVKKWDRVLKRGDIFLCANAAQKDFYRGVLSAVGRINPVTYSDDLILITPYGVYRDDPVQKTSPINDLIGTDKGYLKVLWFGGIYPWFDIRSLADAIKEVNKTTPAKLIVVGAKNPFNKHPDFIARYDEFMKYVSTKEMRQYVIVQDWIDFNDRADWYLDSDVVVVFNREGEENKLAWRTRLVDFMWADLPVLTNGGDPLGEVMLAKNAAVRMPSTESKDVAATIVEVLSKDRTKIIDLRKNMHKLKADYYWDVATAGLTQAITDGVRARDLEMMGYDNVQAETQTLTAVSKIPVRKIIAKARKIPAYANKYGYKATGMVVSEMVRRKLSSKGVSALSRKKPAYVFVSHQLDMSGAPFIAIDMALEFKAAGKNVVFYTYPPAHNQNLARLTKAGITPRLLMNRDMVPNFIAGDTLILNTVAHSETSKEAVFTAAENGTIKEIIWYLHEDGPELLFRSDEKKRIVKMLDKDQLRILIAAKKMKGHYVEYFDTDKNIVLQPYRHVLPQKYHRQLKAADFTDKLTFVLPGTIGDGRKGQLPIFYAFVQFLERYYRSNEASYRDFELVLVGISSDFLSRQILNHADAIKGHFSYHPRVTWNESLEIAYSGNITICYSLRECLPLFVFEGMTTGHPLLRNDSSGVDEQLVEGKNGYLLDSQNFEQVVATIEIALNKAKTSDAQLAAMSKYSYSIASKQADNSYLDCLGKRDD